MSAVDQRLMCEAVARATLLPGRTPRTCASAANTQVEHDGQVHRVCKMHEASWARGDHAELAERWGWAS